MILVQVDIQILSSDAAATQIQRTPNNSTILGTGKEESSTGYFRQFNVSREQIRVEEKSDEWEPMRVRYLCIV